MRRVGKLLGKYWRVILIWLVVAAAAYFILFHGIMSLAPAYSPTEISTQASSISLRTIWNEPINAPFKLLVWLPFKLGHHSVAWARIAAAAIGMMSALLFYFVFLHLFSKRVALLSTLLFVFSTAFLQASHLGTPLIMQMFGSILLMASVPLYARSRYKVVPLYVSTIAIAALLYTPTMPWFIVVGSIVAFTGAKEVFGALHLKHKIILPLLFLGLLTPLLWSVVRDPASILTLLGLPQHFPTVQAMASNLYSFLKSLVWRGTGPAEIMLVGAPIVNVIEAGLIVAGLVTLIRAFKLKSNLFITGGIVLFVVLVAFGNTTYLPLMPFLFLLLASGIFHLLNEWFDVFPLNPVANIIGTTAIIVLVGTSVLYHVRSFYVAWPHSDATHAAFTQAQPAKYFELPSDTKETVHF